jgi:peptidoglycan/xylan/chitin deacetylase (PgdA/CDA1 family)
MRQLPAVAGVVGRLARAEIVTAVETKAPLVGLTIDDGPDPATTGGLLERLAAHRARATFFVIGERALRHPTLVAQIAAGGHELGNHLMRDEPSVRLDAAEFERQLDQVDGLLRPYGPVLFFRPGSGWFTPRMLRAGAHREYRCAMGSSFRLVAGDYSDPAAVAARLARRSRPGSIIVLHEGTAHRRDVIEVADLLLGRLHARGLQATSLSRLIAGAGHQ